MEEVIDIQKLLRRQKAYMKGILVMIEKLFEIQTQITELTIKELKKEKKRERAPSDLLSSKDVCSMLKISVSTLYRMRTYDNFPSMKIEGRKSVMFVSIRPRACFSPSYNKVKSQTKHVWLLTLL